MAQPNQTSEFKFIKDTHKYYQHKYARTLNYFCTLSLEELSNFSNEVAYQFLQSEDETVDKQSSNKDRHELFIEYYMKVALKTEDPRYLIQALRMGAKDTTQWAAWSVNHSFDHSFDNFIVAVEQFKIDKIDESEGTIRKLIDRLPNFDHSRDGVIAMNHEQVAHLFSSYLYEMKDTTKFVKSSINLYYKYHWFFERVVEANLRLTPQLFSKIVYDDINNRKEETEIPSITPVRPSSPPVAQISQSTTKHDPTKSLYAEAKRQARREQTNQRMFDEMKYQDGLLRENTSYFI